MKSRRAKLRPTGQSLIEFVIVLPTILFLVAAILPLVRFSNFSPWLDERLWLSHFSRLEGSVHSELEHSHERDMVPVYFRQTDLSSLKTSRPFGSSVPPLGNSFPGSLYTEDLCATLEKGTRPLLETKFFPKKISRDFAMVRKTPVSERSVPSLVRRFSLLRFFEVSSGILDSLKLNFFHLNLDILPEEESTKK